MKKIKISAFTLLLVTLGTACQEDEPIAEAAPDLTEFLAQGLWELAESSVQFDDGSTEELALDYCDINTWEFFENDNVIVVYVHWRASFVLDEECDQQSFRIVQSYQQNDGKVTLEGPRQGLTEDWAMQGFAITEMRVERVNDEKIRLTYRVHRDGPEAARAQITQTFFLSSRRQP